MSPALACYGRGGLALFSVHCMTRRCWGMRISMLACDNILDSLCRAPAIKSAVKLYTLHRSGTPLEMLNQVLHRRGIRGHELAEDAKIRIARVLRYLRPELVRYYQKPEDWNELIDLDSQNVHDERCSGIIAWHLTSTCCGARWSDRCI